jgi:hypothetical protein
MKWYWYIVYIAALNLFLIGTSLSVGFTKEGIQALLPNYITITTAILAVTFAAITLKESQALNQQRHSIVIVVLTAIIGLFASIFALYFSYYQADFFLFGATMIFFAATIAISSSIFAMTFLIANVITPKKSS